MSIRPNRIESAIRPASTSGKAQDHLTHLEHCHGRMRPHNPKPIKALDSDEPQYTTLPNCVNRTNAIACFGAWRSGITEHGDRAFHDGDHRFRVSRSQSTS